MTTEMPTRQSPEPPWDSEFGLDLTRQPRWKIPEIVMIEAAIVGHPIKRTTNPNHPYTPEEIRNSAIECIEAGAVAIHLHVRSNEGNIENDTDQYIKKMRQIVEPIREKYGDSVVIDGCDLLPTFEDEIEFIKTGLLEISPVNAFHRSPSKLLKAEVQMMQENGVKPQIALYCDGDLDRATQWLIETNIPEKPLYWLWLPSYVCGGTPLPNEFAMVESLPWYVRRIREIDPESVIMICSAGRASSYLSTMAMLMGLHVRVGMEDTIYKWPHKDDLIDDNAEIISETIKIARALGRRPATANEFRELVGLPSR